MKLRQRIIGAVVVAALAIIFVPLLFKGSAPSSLITNQPKTIKIAAEIPPEPAKPISPQTIVMNQDKDLNAVSSDLSAPANSVQPATNMPLASNNRNNTSNIAIPIPATAQPAAAPAKVAMVSTESSGKKTTKQSIKHATTTKLTKDTTSTKTSHHTTTKVASNSTTTKHATDKKTKTTNPVTSTAGVAWVVQLGSFANATNAKQLETELRSHGFKAYTQSIKTSLGTLVRVSIGPEVKREKADAIKERLAKEMQIKSVVVAYNPTSENT